MSTPVAVTEADFQAKVLDSDKPVLVDFWAAWCGPCKAIAPILEELASDLGDKALIAKVDVDECNNLAAKYAIRSIPTLMLFKNGEHVDTVVGLTSKTDLLALIESHI